MGTEARDGRWRRRRLDDGVLYVCEDRRAAQSDLAAWLDAVLGGGADLVQLRDKTASPEELRVAASTFREAAEHHGALFVLNDAPDLAAEVGADGVHVGQEDASPAEARRHVGPERLVGRSTHTTGQIDQALREDADYFSVGPVHPTPTKQGRPGVGLDPVGYAASVADRPWFVTGGMAPATAPEVLASGARRLVVVRYVTETDDPGAAAREMATLLRAV